MFSTVSLDPFSLDPDFRRRWEELIAGSDNLYLQYQTPEWYAYLHQAKPGDRYPAVAVHDGSGRLIGLAPLSAKPFDLPLAVRGWSLGRFRLKTAAIQGSLPLLPDDPLLYDRLFEAIADSVPECDAIHLPSVATGSFCWKHIQGSDRLRDRFLVYIPGGVRPFHSITLPATFEQYLSKFKAKKRYNLGRQVRLLRDHCGGALRLERIEGPEQVAALVRAAGAVVPNSWQGQQMIPGIYEFLEQPGRLEVLARRGLLRSYVLSCGEQPCAIVLGNQVRDIYQYAEISYDQAFSSFSPGTVLLYLLIQDLCEHRPPRRVHFGLTDADYKRYFGNVHGEDATVLLLRKTVANRARRACHGAYRSLHRALRDWLRNRKGAAGANPADGSSARAANAP